MTFSSWLSSTIENREYYAIKWNFFLSILRNLGRLIIFDVYIYRTQRVCVFFSEFFNRSIEFFYSCFFVKKNIKNERITWIIWQFSWKIWKHRRCRNSNVFSSNILWSIFQLCLYVCIDICVFSITYTHFARTGSRMVSSERIHTTWVAPCRTKRVFATGILLLFIFPSTLVRSPRDFLSARGHYFCSLIWKFEQDSACCEKVSKNICPLGLVRIFIYRVFEKSHFRFCGLIDYEILERNVSERFFLRCFCPTPRSAHFPHSVLRLPLLSIRSRHVKKILCVRTKANPRKRIFRSRDFEICSRRQFRDASFGTLCIRAMGLVRPFA